MNIPNEQMAPQQPPGAMPGEGAAPGQGPEMQNPILDAIATIAAYIAALTEQGDPTAPQLQQIMGQFVQTIQQGAGGGAGAPTPSPMAQPPVSPTQLNRAQAPGGGQGMNPMLSGMKSKNEMQGKVAVI